MQSPLLLVILAGGSSSRLWPLHEKSLIRFLGKPLFEHQLQTYIGLGFTNIAVVCNRDNHDPIQQILNNYPGQHRTFVQKEAHGMGDALLTLKPLLTGLSTSTPVYICQVHDIFEPTLHSEMLTTHKSDPSASLLASYRVKEYFPGGYLQVDSGNNIHGIIEKPAPGQEPSDLVNIVAHIHPDLAQLLDQVETQYQSNQVTDDHYERAMAEMMKTHTYKAVPYDGQWFPIKYPWHVLDAMNFFLEDLSNYRAEGVTIEDNVQIKGPVYIEKGVRIFSGADIRGPVYLGENSVVGQFASIRHSMIHEDCIVGLTAEVNRSYLGRGTWMHSSKALDTICADNNRCDQHINLSAGMVTANFRQDSAHVKSTVKGQRLDTGRSKLGAMIGAGAFIGINSCLAPGVKLGEDCQVGMGTNVSKDIASNTRYYFDQETGSMIEKEIR
jgi:UDP-N-acetylglucosamine diphosphorylase / glucose-1-phosphate thymidylyltransferase / UDP-N-acetylgalactosamine diphosphorylase / glucosamine-1-phosphate N-acetyltransferase / galactosamine-1-phosphate N-acetyltransferase